MPRKCSSKNAPGGPRTTGMPFYSRGIFRISALLAAFACFGPPSPVGASPTSINVMIDGLEVPTVKGQVRVPVSAREIVFRVGDPPFGFNKTSKRVRYRLDGITPDWVQRPGIMVLSLHFYDRKGDQVAQETYEASGKSSGWNKTVGDSAFTHRTETLSVPPLADTVCVFITSAGPPTSMGIFAVEDVVVSRISGDASPPEVLIDSAPFLQKRSDSLPPPLWWMRDGMRPSMASIVDLGRPHASANAFYLNDDDPMSHAEWHTLKEAAPKVKPGERLSVEWNELYNIGFGDMFDAPYGVPPAGRYRFRVQEVDTAGIPTKPEESVEIVVPLPYWQESWFEITCSIVIAAAIAIVGNSLVRRRIRLRLQRLHQENLVERERLRIAQDIHDDLGARLTNISLASSRFATDEIPASARDNFKEISSMTRELVAALYETVWTVNPKNDQLDSLASFLCQIVQNACRSAGIRCRIDAAKMPAHWPVSSEIRHQVSMVAKEAVNNTIKHSGATLIRMKIEWLQPVLQVQIEDDGRGFSLAEKEAIGPPSPAGTASSNGLENMSLRMKAIKGSVTVLSEANIGTKIRMVVSVPYPPGS